MTDGPGEQTSPEEPRRRWTDQGRELGTQVALVLRTLWSRQLSPVLQRVLSAAAADPSAPPPPADDLVERHETAGAVVVPAQGHVFAFTVRTTLTWTSTGVHASALAWYAQHFTADALDRVRRIAAERSPTVPAHRAGDLEAALRRTIAEREPPPWRYRRGPVSVDCRPDLSVRLDERVAEVLRPHWEGLIRLDCENELFIRRARYAERLNRHWVTIMDEFVDGPGDAAQALKEEVARARRHMMAEQEAAARWSEHLLRERRRYEDLNAPFTRIDVIPEQPHGSRSDGAQNGADPA
ncbi:hypothetical protein ACFY3U_18715 [Micromonospora sp. NPDC000089]|uniref:hypothetical protein n=1 Tax=unclassified Micromonospora TaxID=2617518 RepID=UPI0036792618